jgi:hexosaminidase
MAGRRTRVANVRPGTVGTVLAAVAGMTLAVLAGPSSAGAAPGGRWAPAEEPAVIPRPVAMEVAGGRPYEITADTRILARGGSGAVAVAEYLADLLRPSTGYDLPVATQSRGGAAARAIRLELSDDAGIPAEGYTLDASHGGVKIVAGTPAGLFYGVQTLRQLLPAEIESAGVADREWTVPGVHIVDYPRFEWRGAMLDVSRHFFTVDEVKRYIDLLAMYKINVFHMHLSDDQGWRVMIDEWPRLAEYGGSTEVGGGPGGYYTKAQFRDIVDYAADRYMMLVPEIDSPGHTNAALASYAELNCDGVAPPLYTGIAVGFSSLCIDKEITYEFMDDVIGEISALAPGPVFHIGGDEAHATSDEDYRYFVDRVQDIVQSHGKRMMGWAEIAQADLEPGAIAQNWATQSGSHPGTNLARMAVAKGADIVMSPASKAYLDMK